MKTEKKKKSKSRIIAIIALILVFVISLGVVLYPVIAEFVAGLEKSNTQANYEKIIEEKDNSDIEAELQAAREYNDRLTKLTTFSNNIDSLKQDYHSLLNLAGNGLMCYVEIPVIDVYLPVYHGDDPKALELGVEHLMGTSLPVGGEGTHAVLSAHTGLSSEKMFTDLESVEEGDVFYIHVLNQTLAYQVDQINIVLPDDVSNIQIYKGEDYVTLITCTPYAVNTHRLLVRGTRIPYEEAKTIEEEIAQTKEVTSQWESQYIKGIICGVVIFAFIVVIYVVVKKIRKRRKHLDEKSSETNNA